MRRLMIEWKSIVGIAVAVLVTCHEVNAQSSYQTGQNVSPAFEGWEAIEDG